MSRTRLAPGQRFSLVLSASSYRGRFAPSPTGPLHLGSLLAALASYLDARAQRGAWLVRIENIDPPREVSGADRRILQTLVRHGLSWNEPVLYQGTRINAYAAAVERLLQSQNAFYCICSRQELASRSGQHSRDCPRSTVRPSRPAAVRVPMPRHAGNFEDLMLGAIASPDFDGRHSFVVQRRDGCYAYHLAVVVDDAYQRINCVVRGRDLLDSTPYHLHLQRLLGFPPPAYGHLPLLLNRDGQKLSKQNLAEPVDDAQATSNLLACLRMLGQEEPPRSCQRDCASLLEWAAAHWERAQIPRHGFRAEAEGY